MSRLLELMFAAFLVYLAYRRIARPFRRGYAERDRERVQEHLRQKERMTVTSQKLDRTSVRDAEFKDLA